MASKRRLKKKSCLSKNFYKTEEDARMALEARERFGIFGLHWYRCNFCCKFHIGHPRRSGNRDGFRRGNIE